MKGTKQISPKTKVAYTREAERLRRRFTRETGQEPEADCTAFLAWMDTLYATIKPDALRQNFEWLYETRTYRILRPNRATRATKSSQVCDQIEPRLRPDSCRKPGRSSRKRPVCKEIVRNHPECRDGATPGFAGPGSLAAHGVALAGPALRLPLSMREFPSAEPDAGRVRSPPSGCKSGARRTARRGPAQPSE